MPRVWEAHLRLTFSGMKSSGRVLDPNLPWRCCLQSFLPIMPLLWLPRLVLSRSSSSLLLPWAAVPPDALRCSFGLLSRRYGLVCRLQCATACTRSRPCWRAVAFLMGRPALLPAPTPVLHMSAPVLQLRALWPRPAWVWRDVPS